MGALRATSAFAVLLVGGLIASAGSARACGDGKLLFEDKFEAVNSAWKFDGSYEGAKPGGSGLVAEIPPGETVSAVNTAASYKSFELCAVFTSKGTKDTGNHFGLRFWTPDGNKEYWAVTFTERGRFVVNHYHDDKTDSITSLTDDPSLLKAGAPNEVNVRIDGTKGAFFVNGKKVSSFTGEMPDGGSVIGFVMYADKKGTQPTDFNLKSIQVRALTSAELQSVAAPTAASSVIELCNKFGRPIHFAIAFQNSDVWTSEGWLTVPNGKCGQLTKYPDLTAFYYYGETDVYDGKQTTWGTKRDFAVKKSDFILQDADTELPGARMVKFSGPIERDTPAQAQSLTFTPDLHVMTVTGAKPH
jgi:uncharacterized membrane protein